MYIDTLNNPIFNDTDIFNIIYSHNLDLLPQLTVHNSEEIQFLEKISEIKFNQTKKVDIDQKEYDQLLQNNWFIPNEYENIDIEQWVYDQCINENEIIRAKEEIKEFKNRNMIKLLKWLKYFVDTCRKNNIVWGVGRGSSVSSYVLYLIGVHKINSLKYNLDWREFLR